MTKSLAPKGYGETFRSWALRLRADCSRRQRLARHTRENVYLSSPLQWSTPRATDGEKGGPNQSFGAGGIPLPAQAAQWPTVTVADSRASASLTAGRTQASKAFNPGITLTDAIRLSSLPVLQTFKDGSAFSEKRPTLSPLFVEWLMGWPAGWTASECSETALCHWKQHMRFALSCLASPPPAPAPQLSLFA
jgi:hypothetical protein